jgi:KaiC/GvpD/RAD55 family RecA-like ATPase
MFLAARSGCALLLLLGVAAHSARADDEAVKLQWKFTPGQTSRYAASLDIVSRRTSGGKSEESISKQTTDMSWLVDSVDDDGNAHITQTIQRVRSESSGGGRKEKFDSKDDKSPDAGNDTPAEVARVIVDQPVYLTIDPRGKVVDVRLSDKFSERLKQSPQYGALAAMFSRDNLKQMASMNTLELPVAPVKKGATWEQQAPLFDPIAGRQKRVTVYRYDGADEHDGRQLDKISATAKTSLADEKKPPQGFTVKDQKSNGVIWFDREAGRIHEMQMTNKVVSELGTGAGKVEQTLIIKANTRLIDEKGDEPAR